MNRCPNNNFRFCPKDKECFLGYQTDWPIFFAKGGSQTYRETPIDNNTRAAFIIQGMNFKNQFEVDFYVGKLGRIYRDSTSLPGLSNYNTWHDFLKKIESLKNKIDSSRGATTNGFIADPSPWGQGSTATYTPSQTGREWFLILDSEYENVQKPGEQGYNAENIPMQLDFISRTSLCRILGNIAETTVVFTRTFLYVDKLFKSWAVCANPVDFQVRNPAGAVTSLKANPFTSLMVCIDPRAFDPTYKPDNQH